MDELSLNTESPDDPPMGRLEFLARAASTALMIASAYYLGHSDFFFYQGF